MIDGQEHYRNTGNVVRFGLWDARAIAPLALLIVFKSWILFYFGVVTFVFFLVIERKGLTFNNFLRKLRCKITGDRKPVSSSLSRYLH